MCINFDLEISDYQYDLWWVINLIGNEMSIWLLIDFALFMAEDQQAAS